MSRGVKMTDLIGCILASLLGAAAVMRLLVVSADKRRLTWYAAQTSRTAGSELAADAWEQLGSGLNEAHVGPVNTDDDNLVKIIRQLDEVGLKTLGAFPYPPHSGLRLAVVPKERRD